MASSRPARERRPAVKFEGTYSSFKSQTQDFTLAKGDGTPIASIKPIADRIAEAEDDDDVLKLLHSAIFGDVDTGSIKSQLLTFQGLRGGTSAADDNVRKRASKTLEQSSDGVLRRTAALLGFKVDHVPVKKLAAKINKFLGHPDPGMCETDSIAAGAEGAVGAVEDAAPPAKPPAGRKRRSAPAGGGGGRKAKAQRGRRGGSAAQAASVAEEGTVQTVSEATHSEAAMSGSVPADGEEPAAVHEAAPQPTHEAALAEQPPPSPSAAAAAAPDELAAAPAPATDDTAAGAEVAEPSGEAVAAGEAIEAPAAAAPSDAPAGEGEEAAVAAAEPEHAAAAAAESDSEAAAVDAGTEVLAPHPPGEADAGAEPADLAMEEPPVAGAEASAAGVEGGSGGVGAALQAAAAPLAGGSGGLNLDVVMHAADESEPESPDEVLLNGDGGLGSTHSLPMQPAVAGVPQVAPRSSAAAPAIAIPVGGKHASADPPEAGGEEPSMHAAGTVLGDGTMLADHPPLTPVHPEVPADSIMEDTAMPDPLQGVFAEAAVVANGDADGAAAAAPAPEGVPGAAPSADEPAANKAGTSKSGAAVAVHSQPAKVSVRGRRGRGGSAPTVAAPAPPAAEARTGGGAEAAAPASGMRTRGRETAHAPRAHAGTQDEATQIRGYVMQVMQGFDRPEQTLVKDLRLAMEQRFGVQLNTFLERKDDVADALGEFFTELGYAEKC